MIPLAPRPEGYNPLIKKHLKLENVKVLGLSGSTS
jgi:hypothetical protein